MEPALAGGPRLGLASIDPAGRVEGLGVYSEHRWAK